MSTMSNCEQCQIVNNVKLSNCQQCQIVKLSTMSNCQIFKLSKGQNVKISKFVGDIEKALHGPIGPRRPCPPWPQRMKAQGRRTCFVPVYLLCWSKSQSISIAWCCCYDCQCDTEYKIVRKWQDLQHFHFPRIITWKIIRHSMGRRPEVNISPKISISAQPLKMALHRNPAMHGSRMVIFLHDSKKALF